MGKFSDMDILIQESYDRGFKNGFNEAKEAGKKIVEDLFRGKKEFNGIKIRLAK